MYNSYINHLDESLPKQPPDYVQPGYRRDRSFLHSLFHDGLKEISSVDQFNVPDFDSVVYWAW
jgi:hypothetical protein